MNNKKPERPPAEKSGDGAFERMKELTRRVLSVPKSNLPKPRRKR